MIKINRNSLGQFKRSIERMIHTSVWYTSKVIKTDDGVETTVQVRNVANSPRVVFKS